MYHTRAEKELTLKRLGDYDLLKVINPKLSFSPELEALLQSAHDTITWFELLFLKGKYDKGMLYIMALLYKLDKEDREFALKRLSVTSRLRDRILNGFMAVHEILRRLKPGSLVETYHLLIMHDMESVLFSMALTQDSEKKKAVSHFLLELRNVKPLLKGSDLKRLGIPPGPEYSKILKKILDEKLMKRLQTKEEEMEFVKEIIH